MLKFSAVALVIATLSGCSAFGTKHEELHLVISQSGESFSVPVIEHDRTNDFNVFVGGLEFKRPDWSVRQLQTTTNITSSSINFDVVGAGTFEHFYLETETDGCVEMKVISLQNPTPITMCDMTITPQLTVNFSGL